MKMKMKMWILLATWLLCNIVIDSSIAFPTVTYNMTNLPNKHSYETFVSQLQSNFTTKSESHGIPIIRKPQDVTKENMFLLVDLHNYDSEQSVTVVTKVVDMYVVGFKAGNKAYFFEEAPPEALTDILFKGTSKTKLELSTNYNKLGDNRAKVGLGNGAMGKAIDKLCKFTGTYEKGDAFTHSLLVIIQMISEAARFKFIESKIAHGIMVGYRPESYTLSLENKWGQLSKQIQRAGKDGKFDRTVELKYPNGNKSKISNVAEIKPDISLLKYFEPNGTIAEAISFEEDGVGPRALQSLSKSIGDETCAYSSPIVYSLAQASTESDCDLATKPLVRDN